LLIHQAPKFQARCPDNLILFEVIQTFDVDGKQFVAELRLAAALRRGVGDKHKK
jgi:hypothetical protein